MTRQAACGGPLVGGGLLPAELTTRYDHVLEEHVELGCRHRSHRSRKCRRPARMPAIKKMIRNIPELCGTSGTCASRGHHDLQNAPRGAERGGVELGVGAVAMVVGQTRKSSSPWSQGAIPTDPGSSLSIGVAGVGPRICGRSPKSSRDGFGGPGLGGPMRDRPLLSVGSTERRIPGWIPHSHGIFRIKISKDCPLDELSGACSTSPEYAAPDARAAFRTAPVAV